MAPPPRASAADPREAPRSVVGVHEVNGALDPHTRPDFEADPDLGFGRIVTSEIGAPNMLAILV